MSGSKLEVEVILRRTAAAIPASLRSRIVVIGSLASAWAFRDLAGTEAVATKDIDLLLHPALQAAATARDLGADLIAAGWQPVCIGGRLPGNAATPSEHLPVLRLRPPDGAPWFVELLATPAIGQTERRAWHRVSTELGEFVLPSFRQLPLLLHAADTTPFDLAVARPATMALAHLLEHAEPDRTPIANLPGNPPRFLKDVGRGVALWWLATEQSVRASRRWRDDWQQALDGSALDADAARIRARQALAQLSPWHREAHRLASTGLLAAHAVTLDGWHRAATGLDELLQA